MTGESVEIRYVSVDDLEIGAEAKFFPEMKPEDYQPFKESVRNRGVLEPLKVIGNKVIDGRHRLKAAKETGKKIVPTVEANVDQDLPAYLLALNTNRRHLTPSQVAMLATGIYKAFQEKIKDEKSGAKVGPKKKAADELAKEAGVSTGIIKQANFIDKEGTEEDKHEVLEGRVAVHVKEKQIRKRKEEENQGVKEHTAILADEWGNMTVGQQKEAMEKKSDTKFNKQTGEGIEWAQWSWNPITGCLEGCEFCYARDIANRFFRYQFEPTFYPDRLQAPENTKPSGSDHISIENVFLCSMADMWAEWNPPEWLDAILDVCEKNSQWNYLTLTKQILKVEKVIGDRDIPQNLWFGATIHEPSRMKKTVEILLRIKEKHGCLVWISFEPMYGMMPDVDLTGIDWIVIGGASRTSQTPEYIPPFLHVAKLTMMAKQYNVKVFHKANMDMGDKMRMREIPECTSHSNKTDSTTPY